MAYVKIKHDIMEKFSNHVFSKFGFTAEESKIITDVLLMSDMYGIESHGVQRMVLYYKTIKNGRIHMDAKPEMVFETPISAVIDNHFGVGQLVGHKAMNIAIEKAKANGMGFVSVRNSNHYGISGYYAKLACNEGLIGISTTNSEAIMVPTYGKVAMLGSNPIAIAMPATPYDFFFDASTTVVTRGKVEVYNKKGAALPEGWTLNSDGMPSTDAADILENINNKNGGGILPLGGITEQLGGHKGYGYGMIAEIFASILSQGLTSNHTHIGPVSGTCHSFIAINPNLFGDPEAIKAHLSNY
ncbi:MAG: Ldh family oxidoreductase [Anaerotignaceae bacterium]